MSAAKRKRADSAGGKAYAVIIRHSSNILELPYRETKPDESSSASVKSIADSNILYPSLLQSRRSWMQGALFQRSSCSKAPRSKKEKEERKSAKPAAIRLGQATLEISPHIFTDTRFYALDYSKEKKPRPIKKATALDSLSANTTPQMTPGPETLDTQVAEIDTPQVPPEMASENTPAHVAQNTTVQPATAPIEQINDSASTASTADLTELVFEFTSSDLRIGEGDRYLIPRETILQRIEGANILMSLLLVYPQNYPQVYSPVTIRITSCSPKLSEYLFSYVSPQDIVRDYMTNIMQTLPRSSTGWLQYRISQDQREMSLDVFNMLSEKVSKRERERQLKEEDDLVKAALAEAAVHAKRKSSHGRVISSPGHVRSDS